MADISFPAHITITRAPDVDGLPILTAQATVSDGFAMLDLPPGPRGAPGGRGRPRTTFRKMGEIADAAARPTGLGPDDRGCWWHRIDDNGMDVWTGTEWRHSPDAVGPRGAVAEPTTITVTDTVSLENLTEPAVEFAGPGANQKLKVTVPSGLRGPKGPPGASGQITESPDYDKVRAPGAGSILAYDRSTRKFRSVATPLGLGPWSWFQEDFAAERQEDTGRIEGATFAIPPLPFRWRPIVYGHIYTRADAGTSAEATVRLHHSQGEIVATSIAASGDWMYLPVTPCYRDGTTSKVLSPTSDFATVPAGQPANLVVAAEKVGSAGGKIGLSPDRASIVVFAEPIE
ncbi:hypothetical protein F3087_02885 [Nocardia colli]|uniref:Minor tail protein n=1 Tax=Nocardia colli TaxID=2545717 RepID=A0A5N0EN39_9NOCA|nr:hypothetical protein [Nocardia colli]KAA8890270.1 hypothetical protein F3087_02885 [Nocardia colli]